MNGLSFLFAILATWRIARIVTKDTVSDQARKIVGKQAAGKKQYSPEWYLAELINCQFCVGVWASILVAFLVSDHKKGVKSYLLNFMAIAGGQNLLALWIDQRGDYE